jgi:hypothetical protein
MVRVEVADEGSGAPVRRRSGMVRVEVADDWGVEPENGGKLVWFTLPSVQAS